MFVLKIVFDLNEEEIVFVVDSLICYYIDGVIVGNIMFLCDFVVGFKNVE